PSPVDITFPAFLIEKEIDLTSILFKTASGAGHSDTKLLNSRTFQIQQKTLICVDESGAVGKGTPESKYGPGDSPFAYPRIIFNKPFYFIIASNKAPTPLFVSYVTNGMKYFEDSCQPSPEDEDDEDDEHVSNDNVDAFFN
ncbi:hypothetical protein HMI54_014242, partial [Coelomomyces lativittatus]